jgi:uncharacterized membrane protein YfbV (UPF0208 family)
MTTTLTIARTAIPVACAMVAIGLAFRGTYWLGRRNERLATAREHFEAELASMLAEGDDGDDGGEHRVRHPMGRHG